MDAVRELFFYNRPIVLFIYGLTFFVMGLAIFLQSRRHSRLRLARDLQWLAAFGVLHGIHEWGDMFIPIQDAYLPPLYIDLLRTVQIVLLALSFVCLLMFGAVTLESRWPRLRWLVLALGFIWLMGFWLTLYPTPSVTSWHHLATIWARYLLGLPGSLLAAYGLRYQTQSSIAPLRIKHIYQTLQVAGGALLAYALFGGLVVSPAGFFPASVINRALVEQLVGVPIEVLRSLTGLVLAVTIIRALEVFEIELDRLIEQMEIERIQTAERDRISQEIHDGAIQGVYSASLILESMEPLLEAGSEAAQRLEQSKKVLSAVNTDLRGYMVSLRAQSAADPLVPCLHKLANDPRFYGLLDIRLQVANEPTLRPLQVSQVVAIVQEALSNVVRHARARKATISVGRSGEMVTIEISDDGRGFDTSAASAGYGLRSMRDRARLLGGQLDITSTPGKGTVTRLTFLEENS